MTINRPSCSLNTALVTPLVRPLCQKPPSPMMLIALCGSACLIPDELANERP